MHLLRSRRRCQPGPKLTFGVRHRLTPRGLVGPGLAVHSRGAEKTGQLDAETRERIALAVSVTTLRDGGITVHAAEAVRRGASPAEVAEVPGFGLLLGPAVPAALLRMTSTERHDPVFVDDRPWDD